MTDPYQVLQRGHDSSGRPLRATLRMWQAFDLACERSGVVPTVVQGAFMGSSGASASAGTHAQAGCLDLRVWDLSPGHVDVWMRAARSIGWAAWLRTEAQGFDPHMHVLLLAEPNMHADARAQESAYRAGRNGLASGAADDFWRPNPIPTFQYTEDDMAAQDVERLTEIARQTRDAVRLLAKQGTNRQARLVAHLDAQDKLIADLATAADGDAEQVKALVRTKAAKILEQGRKVRADINATEDVA